jgi:hypothetical protein
LPNELQTPARATTTEEVDDSMNKLEDDPYSGQNDPSELEKDDLSVPQNKK